MTHTYIFEILEAEPRYVNINNNNKVQFLDNLGTLVDLGSEPINKENFKSNDIQILNDEFKKLVSKNYDTFIDYKNYCKNLRLNMYDYIVKNKKSIDKPRCKRFDIAIQSFDDTFNRDFNAFYQEKRNGDVPINVCVLFDDNYEYLGHIYCWNIGNICFGFGIRSNISNFFNKINVKVSLYLLEGLRLYAKSKHCEHIFIPDPLSNMQHILEINGFIKTRLYEYMIRNKFMGYFSIISMKDTNRTSKNYNQRSVVGYLYSNINKSFIPFDDDYNYGFKIVESQVNDINENKGGKRRRYSKKKIGKTRKNKKTAKKYQ